MERSNGQRRRKAYTSARIANDGYRFEEENLAGLQLSLGRDLVSLGRPTKSEKL